MLSDTIKTLIRNAWDDGYPCLVATNGPQGPNITPKGSMIVFDDQHLKRYGFLGVEPGGDTPDWFNKSRDLAELGAALP